MEIVVYNKFYIYLLSRCMMKELVRARWNALIGLWFELYVSGWSCYGQLDLTSKSAIIEARISRVDSYIDILTLLFLVEMRFKHQI